MHYGRTFFTKNGQPTIVVIGNATFELGQRGGLSKGDIESLERLYHCQNKNSAGQYAWTDWSAFGTCHIIRSGSNDPCHKSRYRFCGTDASQCPCTITGNGKRLCTKDQEDCTDAECRCKIFF